MRIAVLYVKKAFEVDGSRPIIFIAHTNSLADQQSERFAKYFPDYETQRVHSSKDSAIAAHCRICDLLNAEIPNLILFTTDF